MIMVKDRLRSWTSKFPWRQHHQPRHHSSSGAAVAIAVGQGRGLRVPRSGGSASGGPAALQGVGREQVEPVDPLRLQVRSAVAVIGSVDVCRSQPAPVLVGDPGGVVPLQQRRKVVDAALPRPGEAELLRADCGEVRLGRAVDPALEVLLQRRKQVHGDAHHVVLEEEDTDGVDHGGVLEVRAKAILHRWQRKYIVHCPGGRVELAQALLHETVEEAALDFPPMLTCDAEARADHVRAIINVVLEKLPNVAVEEGIRLDKPRILYLAPNVLAEEVPAVAPPGDEGLVMDDMAAPVGLVEGPRGRLQLREFPGDCAQAHIFEGVVLRCPEGPRQRGVGRPRHADGGDDGQGTVDVHRGARREEAEGLGQQLLFFLLRRAVRGRTCGLAVLRALALRPQPHGLSKLLRGIQRAFRSVVEHPEGDANLLEVPLVVRDEVLHDPVRWNLGRPQHQCRVPNAVSPLGRPQARCRPHQEGQQ
mmetsp:Transcript_29641/g.85121  ORF Transcript_29641/g.85121 Transcript_29641/m.85121 type:complete len:476 (+) Transcript_29641:133-1560(+)